MDLPPGPSKNVSARIEVQEDNQGSDEEFRYSDEEGGINVEGIYIPPPPKPYCSSEVKGSRLIITQIKNIFFKSYGDTEVLGPFHKCFNAVIGPNGSGKSNLIDSMLFVFGYRANKIRSKKLSTLIHHSEQHSNVVSCTVAVEFAQIIDKGEDDYEIVPGSKFTVSRTANKDGSSYYMLNGEKKQFKEVAVVLRKHGIDLDHNRFLILQGEVEQISLMAPKGTENDAGMLEYLEDIIGTTRYIEPSKLLNERIEILSNECSEKLNRVKLVETDLKELENPMQEAVSYLKLENLITTKKNFVLQKEIYSLQHEIEEDVHNLEEMKEIQRGLAEKLKKSKNDREKDEQELKKETHVYEKLEKEKLDLEQGINRATNKHTQLNEEMDQTNRKRKKLQASLNQEMQKLSDLKALPDKAEKEIKELNIIYNKNLGKKEELEEEKVKVLASIKNQTEDLQEKKAKIQTKLIDLNAKVNETKSELTLAETELKIYTSNHDTEKTKYEKMKETVTTSKERLSQITKESEKLKKTLPDKNQRLDLANKELLKLKTKEPELLKEIRMKRSSLEESRSSMQASRSKGRVLDALMQQKREGKCPGLFGRLGDLGAIDLKYDVAVSTACGPLDNVVVDTVDTAEWCIEFLKRYDVGQATFIALDKQEHLRNSYQRKINTPENVPRLFDLIQVQDDRVTPAFYYALGDTLVANNIDQGTRIAYGKQRYRVVTLEGVLFEMSGTMSGGGRQVSRGRMGQSVSVININPEDLQVQEAEVRKLEENLRALREAQVKFEFEVNELSPEIRQMKLALDKHVIEIKMLKEQQPVLTQQIKDQEIKLKNVTVDPKKEKKLNDVVEVKRESYEKSLADANILQEQVDKITEEIKMKTVAKVGSVDKKLKEINDAINKNKNNITKLKTSIKTSGRNVEKAEEKIQILQNDIKEAENKMRKMKAEREEIEEDVIKFKEAIQEIEEKIKERVDVVKELKAKVSALSKQDLQIKSEKIDVDENVKKLNGKVESVNSKIHSIQHELKSLKFEEIPNETMEELKTFTEEELNSQERENALKDLKLHQQELKALQMPNMNVVNEYMQKRDEFVQRSLALDEVNKRREKVRMHRDALHARRKDEFMKGYNIIRMKLKEMYQMITLGGDADFELIDSYDPFSEGVELRVRPPKKTWKSIRDLSGGEKTLTSLSLVFALHYYKPSPLYVMDEIDAALDFKNVSIVANYIKEKTKNAQFIIISLRNNMFELGDHLIGIYKTFNVTKSVTINQKLFEDQVRTEYEADQEVPISQCV